MASIRQQILEQLETGQKTIGELYESVKGKRASVDKAVQRLLKRGIIERIDRGIYQKSAPLPAEIDFSELSVDERSNHELNHIGDMMDQTVALVEKMYVGTPVVERLEIMSNLLKSAAGFAADLQSEFDFVKTEWKADDPEADVDKIVNEANRQSLAVFVDLLFEHWSSRTSPNDEK